MNNQEVKILNIDDVLPNRFQPRIQFDEKAINELAESIKTHGVIQPIVVRRIGDKYEIIAGERRYKASVLAGKITIPALITTLDDKDSAEIALIENVQRQNLTPIEEAISYKKILDMGYLTQVTLGEKLGKTQSTIANKLRLLNLTDEVQEALMQNKISERHARSLLRLENDDQIFMLNRIVTERLTVRRTDEEIEKMLNEEKEGVDNMNNNDLLKEMGIPTEPIVEPVVESQPVVEDVVAPAPTPAEPTINSVAFDMPTFDSNVPEFKDVEPAVPDVEPIQVDAPAVEPVPQIQESVVPDVAPVQPAGPEVINPGFMDVDKIASTATDVYQEPAPLADIDMLMDTSNNPSMDVQESPMQDAAQVAPAESDAEVPGGGKFFTMFAREEDTNPDFVKDIEGANLNVEFEQPKVEPTFNFEQPNMGGEAPVAPAPEPVQPSVTPEPVQQAPVMEQPAPAPAQPELDPNKVFTMAQEPIKNEELDKTMDFTQQFKPFNLNDDETFTKEEPVQPAPVQQMPAMEPITFDDMGEIQVKLPEQQKLATTDMKTVINTIRECAATIEKFGFTIETEEIDFPDTYQVTFKIEKG